MNEEQRINLEHLRSTILGDLMPLVENSTLDANGKFNLSLAYARMAGTQESFNKAYERAKQLEEDREKTEALLDVMDAIDIALGEVTISNENDSAIDASNDQPST